MTTILVKTWGCKCGYSRDTPPDLYLKAKEKELDADGNEVDAVYPACPRCYNILTLETDPSKMTQVHIKDADEIENLQINTDEWTKDEEGNDVQIQRPATDEEKKELLARAQETLAQAKAKEYNEKS